MALINTNEYYSNYKEVFYFKSFNKKLRHQ